MSKYYLAYGSNLSVQQMLQRCQDAIYVGTAVLPDHQLLFKGSKSGSYLTVEPKAGYTVPLLVWKISDRDEWMLDRYEGYPTFYNKKMLTVDVMPLFDGGKPVTVDGLIYFMPSERTLGCPALHYYDICHEGYCRFGFDRKILQKALSDSIGKREATCLLKEVDLYE